MVLSARQKNISFAFLCACGEKERTVMRRVDPDRQNGRKHEPPPPPRTNKQETTHETNTGHAGKQLQTCDNKRETRRYPVVRKTPQAHRNAQHASEVNENNTFACVLSVVRSKIRMLPVLAATPTQQCHRGPWERPSATTEMACPLTSASMPRTGL